MARPPARDDKAAQIGRAGFFGSHNILSLLPRRFSDEMLSRAPVIELKKGETLFDSGAVGDGCYWLEQGVMKVSITSHNGEERILAILGPGSIVGELAMIDGLPRSAAVQALRDSKLTFVSRTVFQECLSDHPEIYRHLVTTLVARLRQSDDEVAAASFLSPKARVARSLLRFAEYLGEPTPNKGQVIIRQKMRQNDLAALADVARESVSRILSDWKKRKIVEQVSPSVHLIDKPKLEREADT